MQKNKRIELKFFVVVLIAALMIATFSGCDVPDFLKETNVQDSSLPQITVAVTKPVNTQTDIHATSSPTQTHTNDTTDDPNISIHPTTISEVTPVKTNTPAINKTPTKKPATATPAPTAVS